MPNQPIKPIIIDNLENGVVRGVSRTRMPITASPYAVNFNFDEVKGAAKVRKGTTMIGAQIVNDKPVLGLVNFRDGGSGSNHALLSVVSDGTNSDIYTATAWTKSLEDDTKDLKTRFVQFLDSILRLNGTDAAKSWNGSGAWSTSAGVFDLTNCPAKKYGINYKDRVHLIDTDGILYSSSIPFFELDYDGQSSGFTEGAKLTGVTSGATGYIYKDTDAGATGTLRLLGVIGTFQNNEAITDDATGAGAAVANGVGAWRINWTSKSTDKAKDYIVTPIDPDNGNKGNCVGLGKVGGLMLIFFERAMYSWNGNSTEPDEIVGIGCSSNESIAVDGSSGLLFFANEYGIYITSGGYPKKISTFVDDLFENMSSANYQHIAGGCDGKHYYCSIGNVTIDGQTISNVVLRYTIQSQEWAVYSYPTQPRVFSKYIDGNDVKLVYGDNDGNVIQIDSSATSDTYASTTVPISYELHFADIYDDIIGMDKTIKDKITIDSEASSGATLYCRIDKNTNRHEDWKKLGEIKKEIQDIAISSLRYKVIKFKITGRGTVGRFLFKSFQTLNVNL